MSEMIDTTSSVKISVDAIAAIAGLAATDIDGVKSMAGNLTSEVISKLGYKNLSKGVEVKLDDKNVEVDLSLNLGYGVNIPVVSEKVREKVKAQIEDMTGLNVTGVNVHIQGIELEA
ncbi:MAG: Asp23/Gls24 family envelope stress response protein [Eubacteriales bacterium]|nr:Asp23/Gls24 family envelope stress response protein [Eubacteriales bacterium]